MWAIGIFLVMWFIFVGGGMPVWGAFLLSLFLFGLGIVIIYHFADKDERKINDQEEKLKDPQWCKDNPELAAQYRSEQFLREEAARQRAVGPAVSITGIRKGNLGLYGDLYPGCDSCGGWTIEFDIVNQGTRVIHYVDIYATALDRIGNPCYCSTHRYTQAGLRYTGPLNPDRRDTARFETVWYNPQVDTILVDRIHITFSDGTSQDIEHGNVTNHGF